MSILEQNQVFIIILFYTFVYNCSLILFFTALYQICSNNFTTTFYLYNFPQHSFTNKVILIALFSMAGIPPFIGFFSKLLVFVILLNSHMFLLFPLFFTLLFSGLYFYLQNLRLVLTNPSQISPNVIFIQDLNIRFSTQTLLLSSCVIFFITFGIILLEDLLLYATWVTI